MTDIQSIKVRAYIPDSVTGPDADAPVPLVGGAYSASVDHSYCAATERIARGGHEAITSNQCRADCNIVLF